MIDDKGYLIKANLYDGLDCDDDIIFYQNDTRQSKIVAEFTGKKRAAIDVADCTVVCVIQKSDKEIVTAYMENDFNVTNRAEYVLSQNALASTGKGIITIFVYGSDNERQTFGSIKFKVLKDVNSGSVESTTEYPVLTKLISDTKVVVNDAENAKNEILGVSADIANSEKQRVSAETKREENESSRINEFAGIKKEYESLKSIMIDENNAANLQNQINEANSQLDNIVLEGATKAEVEAVKKRMDSFTSLPEGSTIGDAELIDGRVNIDGKIFPNIGNNIRNIENNVKNFKDGVGSTIVTRGKNVLFLEDQHFESNGLTIDIKDQLITVSGQITSTSSHNLFELDVDMPKLLDGAYSIYVKVTDGESISGRNDVLRLRFYNSEDVQVAEKSAFNHLSLTDINFSNLSNYKVKLMIQAQYTYTGTWSFNLQLASGHDGVYEKAYIKKEYDLYVNKEIDKINTEISTIKQEIGISEPDNPLSKIITDGGLAGLIESYATAGDSLTQGVFDRTNGVAMNFEATSFNSYPSQLSRITGSKVFNLGNAGATACNSQQSISEWHSWLQTANQKKWFTDEFKPKAYIFAIGTNDIGYYGSFTGDVETDIDINDYNNNDTTTSVGGLATMIQKARELQPKAIIFIETIDNTRNKKSTRDEANEKIRAIAKKLNCYLIDMAKYWIQENEASEWMTKYQNGGHLNAMGYLLKTQARITYIDWIIRNNPEMFKEVQFIGTNMEYK